MSPTSNYSYGTWYSFVHEKFLKILCQILDKKSECLNTAKKYI